MNWKDETMITVREILTEERTDMVIEEILLSIPIPWWSRRIVKGLLDQLLPGVIINAIESVLDREANESQL